MLSAPSSPLGGGGGGDAAAEEEKEEEEEVFRWGREIHCARFDTHVPTTLTTTLTYSNREH